MRTVSTRITKDSLQEIIKKLETEFDLNIYKISEKLGLTANAVYNWVYRNGTTTENYMKLRNLYMNLATEQAKSKTKPAKQKTRFFGNKVSTRTSSVAQELRSLETELNTLKMQKNNQDTHNKRLYSLIDEVSRLVMEVRDTENTVQTLKKNVVISYGLIFVLGVVNFLQYLL